VVQEIIAVAVSAGAAMMLGLDRAPPRQQRAEVTGRRLGGLVGQLESGGRKMIIGGGRAG